MQHYNRRQQMNYLKTFYLALMVLVSAQVYAGPVDINSADAGELAAAIVGVGEKKAAVIVQYRESHGPFASVDELAMVKGIGSGTVEKNRHNLMVTPAANLP
jgi:competence protein ComEA